MMSFVSLHIKNVEKLQSFQEESNWEGKMLRTLNNWEMVKLVNNRSYVLPEETEAEGNQSSQIESHDDSEGHSSEEKYWMNFWEAKRPVDRKEQR